MHKVTFLSIITVAVLLLSCCHSISNAADVGQSIDQLTDTFLPVEYRNSNVTLDDVQRFVRAKCRKAAGGIDNSTLYEEVERGATTLMECISSIGNFSALQEEIEEARPIGELDTVFNRYCTKVPEAQSCLRDFNTKLQPCLSAEERKQNVVVMRIINGLVGFMCHRDGDQLALFIAEQGPECLEANREALNGCLNSSFAEYMPKDGSVPDLFGLPELVLTTQHCIDLENFEHCAVHQLERCRDTTPANIAESIFRFIKTESNCKAMIDAEKNKVGVLRVLKDDDSGSATMAGAGITTFALFGGIALLLWL